MPQRELEQREAEVGDHMQDLEAMGLRLNRADALLDVKEGQVRGAMDIGMIVRMRSCILERIAFGRDGAGCKWRAMRCWM